MKQVRFEGEMPAAYDAGLRPLLFDPYAKWFAARAEIQPGDRVLELAAGTGALTEALLRTLPPDATLVATDIHQPMLDAIAEHVTQDPRLTLRTADALDLPFEDACFDRVLCQFGWMFFPDKDLAAREIRRVLVPEGTYEMLTWYSPEDNETAQIVKDVVATCLPDSPPKRFDIPYSFYDRGDIDGSLTQASFDRVAFEDVELMARGSAGDAARGFCRGTPMALELSERIPERHAEVVTAVADAYRKRFGGEHIESKMRALFTSARVRREPRADS